MTSLLTSDHLHQGAGLAGAGRAVDHGEVPLLEHVLHSGLLGLRREFDYCGVSHFKEEKC